MSVSSTNRERQSALTTGNGKNHPERPDASAEVVSGSNNHRADRHTNRLSDKTDEQLLSAYRHGERPSFAALVERYQRELFHFLVRFLGDRAAAESVGRSIRSAAALPPVAVHHRRQQGAGPDAFAGAAADQSPPGHDQPQ